MIRVLIVDDHTMVRAGLQRLLSQTSDIEVVAAADDGKSAITLADIHMPDVVLMDMSLPGLSGIETMHAIRGEHEDVAVVMLTASSERTAILDALDAGADGYLIKDAEPEAIAAGVRSAASGHAPIDPRAARFLLEHRNRQAEPSLTQREDEVLRHVGQGLSNKAIARRLGISEKTVKSHLTRVFSELGVSDRTQAALWVRDQSKDSNRS